jgi:hypothetical protein
MIFIGHVLARSGAFTNACSLNISIFATTTTMTSDAPAPSFITALIAGGIAGTTVDVALFPL